MVRNENLIERVRKAVYEIFQEEGKDFTNSKEVADKIGDNKYKIAQIFRHNFYKMGLLKGKTHKDTVYVKEGASNLPSSIKILTTQEELKMLEARGRERELAKLPKLPKPHEKRRDHMKVTPELVDKAMEHLKEENGKFNFIDVKKSLEKELGKKPIRQGINVILERYEQRIMPGEYQKYEFKEGFAQ
jgi:hypothetical protein